MKMRYLTRSATIRLMTLTLKIVFTESKQDKISEY